MARLHTRILLVRIFFFLLGISLSLSVEQDGCQTFTRIHQVYPDSCDLPEAPVRHGNEPLPSNATKLNRFLHASQGGMNMTDPTSFFQVNCSWGIKGYVQTYNWGQGGPVYTSTDAAQVALLHVPEDHVIMVSLVSQDLCFNLVQDCFDFLGILKKTQCDSEFTRFQSTSLFENSVYFVYTRHGTKYRTGFRLLYSYHQAPEYPRKEAGGDLWNCTVPYYSAFQQHFACSFRTFCSDGRDKIDCPTEELCGPNIRRLGGNCYRFFQPDATISWDAANETCRNYKGLLARLSSTQELHFSGDFLLKTNNVVFAGLSLATPKEPEIFADLSYEAVINTNTMAEANSVPTRLTETQD
ncbi:uncharacterized protein [Littorina saxatilis]|uniref:uncharacterized protein n=1 Tax=Littorina saxatilis TaxID=31220 RepID=UPI0038B56E8B